MGLIMTEQSGKHPSVVAFWCEQAWLDGTGVAEGVLLAVIGDRLASVESAVSAPPVGATRLLGLTLPGFANAHSHAFHRALRGRTHRGAGTFWTWRDRMYELAAVLDPDVYEALATATFAEMVLSGYTCVGEFHYLHHGPGGVPYADRNEIGRRLTRAAEQAGIRMTLLDTCYLHGGAGVPINEIQSRFSDGSAEAWIERTAELAETPVCRVGAAIHSVRAVDPASIAIVAAAAAARDQPVHAHVSEQPRENAECRAAHGLSPVGLLAAAGALSARFTAVHATHVDGGDIVSLGTHRARCCICPTTERELADGIGPTAAMRDAGIGLTIGSDSHAVIDPFEETRAVELDQRLASRQRGTHPPADLLVAATASGYESLGWPGGGRLAVGSLADFVTVRFDGPRLAGADRWADPLAAVLFAATAADVRDVIVGGDHVVRNGGHQRFDVPVALETSVTAAWAATA
jgi:formiminoglutamate deiminase